MCCTMHDYSVVNCLTACISIINIDQYVVLPGNTALIFLIYCLFWERFSCWSLDNKNNMSVAFPMSESIGLDTLIIIVSAILAEIQGF